MAGNWRALVGPPAAAGAPDVLRLGPVPEEEVRGGCCSGGGGGGGRTSTDTGPGPPAPPDRADKAPAAVARAASRAISCDGGWGGGGLCERICLPPITPPPHLLRTERRVPREQALDDGLARLGLVVLEALGELERRAAVGVTRVEVRAGGGRGAFSEGPPPSPPIPSSSPRAQQHVDHRRVLAERRLVQRGQRVHVRASDGQALRDEPPRDVHMPAPRRVVQRVAAVAV